MLRTTSPFLEEFLKETVATKPSSALQPIGREETLTWVVTHSEALSSDLQCITEATGTTSSSQAGFLKIIDTKIESCKPPL